jgi:hypothetical protein
MAYGRTLPPLRINALPLLCADIQGLGERLAFFT